MKINMNTEGFNVTKMEEGIFKSPEHKKAYKDTFYQGSRELRQIEENVGKTYSDRLYYWEVLREMDIDVFSGEVEDLSTLLSDFKEEIEMCGYYEKTRVVFGHKEVWSKGNREWIPKYYLLGLTQETEKQKESRLIFSEAR